MEKSITALSSAIATLTRQARAIGLTDAEWATRAGVRKETLSRLRSRQSCDFATLQSFAAAVGAQLDVVWPLAPESTADGHFPATVDREYEERLVGLAASGNVDPVHWASLGTRFFMSGIAVMLASVADRRRLLDLAEYLHPGASEVAVFNRWLQRSPLKPTRFLPLVDAARRSHAT